MDESINEEIQEENLRPKDACGVFGVFGNDNASHLTYLGLYALQHRGQESAGIVASDGKTLKVHKGMGLVGEVFGEKTLKALTGSIAIGHVRYSTTGSSLIENAQPLLVSCSKGDIAIGHNGNLVNARELREELERKGSIFQTTVDSEIFLHLIARSSLPSREEALIDAIKKVRGAYTLVILWEDEIIGVRDPNGFRPLCLGEKDGAYILASETCALDLIGARFVRDIEPGEIVFIGKNILRSIKPFGENLKTSFCIFENIYFSRPDSWIMGHSVHSIRKQLGVELAREHAVEADVVIPVPDSGNSAALGYSQESGIPLEVGFIRNHYVGRTFLQPSQFVRDLGVTIKLNPIREVIQGKRIIVIDDSIVRGTTSRSRVRILRESGAKEVHVRISCPPHVSPCYYGIDFPSSEELIASSHNLDEIRNYLEADSLGYLSLEGMLRAMQHLKIGFCTACYTRDYPVPVSEGTNKSVMEHKRKRIIL
ncbi:MAG: amidophosphoribosyltransferase [Chlamydiae bacterium]|nr:amidophosphoribosyltransferase [Chlamydiota bacterium]MBI3277932.1 amidophosphoribosyltransferase [Chlamydiota bacterium]